MEKRYALLIDAENADIKYLDNILDEIKNYGNVTYKRMYGDFTAANLKEWNDRALEYAIVPIQQPHYTRSKNAADIMLVIDAMDILYAKNVDGFCIVSNDSDYTRLVNRLIEAGMEVIGMGSGQASKTLKAACTEFKNLEKIFSDDLVGTKTTKAGKGSAGKEDKGDSITSIEKIKRTIEEMIRQNDRAGLGGIKSTLQRRYSDFDERNYGFTTIRKFIESMDDFKIVQEGTSLYVTMNNDKNDEETVVQFILSLLKKGEVEMGAISNKVHERFDGFNFKNYGYNQFSKFISGIPGVKVEKRSNRSYVMLAGTKKAGAKKQEREESVATTSNVDAADIALKEDTLDFQDQGLAEQIEAQTDRDTQSVAMENTETTLEEASQDMVSKPEPSFVESLLPKQITRRIFTKYVEKEETTGKETPEKEETIAETSEDDNEE